MTRTCDTITDLLVAALQTKLASGDWDYNDQTNVVAKSKPRFELKDATHTTQIIIGAYPDSVNEKRWRDAAQTDVKLGIGILRTLDMTDGEPDETHVRSLKQLTEDIRQWAWTAATGYENKCINAADPAIFDNEKFKQGVFFTLIPLTYRLGYVFP